jgi:hypothetical protein
MMKYFNCWLVLWFAVVSARAQTSFDKAFLNQHLADYTGRGFEWENSRIGISDEAPAPWSPVMVEGRTVTLTHRSLELGGRDGSALIQQITSLGQPLLADGMTLTLTDAEGTKHHLTLDAVPLSATNAAALFRGTTTVPGGKATLECRVEFDGFIHLGLDLKPDAGKQIAVHDLRLTTVLHRPVASHYKYLVPYNFTTEQTEEGRIPSTGLLENDIRLPFSPTLWLGTPHLGMEWMCETNHGWNLKHELNAVLIRPVKDRVIWSNVLINQPTSFAKSAHFACAFYIMPTRPAPHPAWNADTILVNSDAILDFKAALAPWHTYYGVHRNTSPTPGHPKAVGRTLTARLRHFGMSTPFDEGPEAKRYLRERRDLREQNIRYLPYTLLHGLPTDLPSPEVKVDKTWLDHWDLRTAKEGHKHYFYICLQHKSAIDFELHYALKTITEQKLDGQYFDLSQPRVAGGYARRHTTDFDRDTFYMPLFGYREFSKRFYITTIALNPQFLTIQHAVIPIGVSSAYAVGSGGEHLKKFFSDDGKNHTHVIDANGITRLATDTADYDPDYFRIPAMMYPVGNWFPVFGQNLSFSDILKGTADYYREHPDRLIYYCRTFLARSLVHGVPVWIRSLDMAVTIKVYQALDRYGPRVETEKIHLATAPKVHLLNADKTPFEYRIEQKPGHILLIVGNSGAETQTAQFDLSAQLDNGAAWSFINAETKDSVPSESGKLSVSITKHDFRILIGTQAP